MLHKFETYQLSVRLYRACEQIKVHGHLRDQLRRSGLSIVLNLEEGSAKPTAKDRRRFYSISLASLRETQALLEIIGRPSELALADRIGGCLYRLTYGYGPRSRT